LKNTETEMEISLVGLGSTVEQAGERISTAEKKSIKVIQFGGRKGRE
jgi:hypothetical protein